MCVCVCVRVCVCVCVSVCVRVCVCVCVCMKKTSTIQSRKLCKTLSNLNCCIFCWVTNQDFQIYAQQNLFSQIVKKSEKLLYARGN